MRSSFIRKYTFKVGNSLRITLLFLTIYSSLYFITLKYYVYFSNTFSPLLVYLKLVTRLSKLLPSTSLSLINNLLLSVLNLVIVLIIIIISYSLLLLYAFLLLLLALSIAFYYLPLLSLTRDLYLVILFPPLYIQRI